MPEDTCFHCDNPATRLCDFIVARKMGGRNESGAPFVCSEEPEVFTCDRPLCDECSTDGGFTTFPEPDRIDYCRDHAHSSAVDSLVVPRSEAVAIQRRLQFRALFVAR